MQKSQRCFDGRTQGLIIMLHQQGWTYKRLAEKFYCSPGTIRRYCTVYRRYETMMNMQKMKPLIDRAVMEHLNKEREKIRTEIVTATMAVTLITLHDKYDWQPEQLVKIMGEIFEQFEAVWEKYVKIEDFYAWLESVGIKVK